MTTKWPSVAYHFHINDEVTIADSIDMREGGDLRAGDIWCHAECYKREPRTGNRLFPVNLPSNPYFRRGKRIYTRVVECEFERVMLSKGESYRFAQFYHDLLVWLNSGDGKENPSELFHISRVEESKSKFTDIVISHTEKAPIDWTETRIIIVDKNRRRKASNEHTLVIDITHWTDSQLADFGNSGIRKMRDEWNQLLAKEDKRVREREREITNFFLITANPTNPGMGVRGTRGVDLLPWVQKNEVKKLKSYDSWYWGKVGLGLGRRNQILDLPPRTPIVILEQNISKFIKNKIGGVKVYLCVELLDSPVPTVYQEYGNIMDWNWFSSKHTGFTRELKSKAWKAYKKEDVKAYISICNKAHFQPIIDIFISTTENVNPPPIPPHRRGISGYSSGLKTIDSD